MVFVASNVSQPKSNFTLVMKAVKNLNVISARNGEVVDKKFLEGKRFGLYFSKVSHQRELAELVSVYSELKAKGAQFEIILCSWDYSREDFQRHCNQSPWLAVDYSDRRTSVKTLSDNFTVSRVPALVVVDENLEIISRNAFIALKQVEYMDF